MAYQFTKDDGTVISGITVKDGIVYGPKGERFGPIKMFPDLQNSDGKRVSIQTAPATNDDGEVMPESAAPGGEADDEGSRVSPTGIKQSGKRLGLGDINGLFASLSSPDRKGGALMTAGDLPSASKFFSEALPTTEEGAKQQGHGSLVTGPDGKPMEMETGTWDENTGSIIEPSVPGTLGGNPENAEDGTSDKPDIAEEVRTIRMNRNSGRGSRRDPRNRDGGSDEPFGGVSETKGNGMSTERRAARAAFLDPNNKGYGAIRAADRAVGAYHQYDTGGMNIDGKDVKFNEGMSRDARFELRGGGIQSKEDAQEFLKKYTNALSTPDTSEE